MPGRDGTGPRGMGPNGWGRGPCGSGRRLGQMGNGYGYGNGQMWNRQAGFAGVAPVAGVIPDAAALEQEVLLLKARLAEIEASIASKGKKPEA